MRVAWTGDWVRSERSQQDATPVTRTFYLGFIPTLVYVLVNIVIDGGCSVSVDLASVGAGGVAVMELEVRESVVDKVCSAETLVTV
jgi:hypothetical protein